MRIAVVGDSISTRNNGTAGWLIGSYLLPLDAIKREQMKMANT